VWRTIKGRRVFIKKLKGAGNRTDPDLGPKGRARIRIPGEARRKREAMRKLRGAGNRTSEEYSFSKGVSKLKLRFRELLEFQHANVLRGVEIFATGKHNGREFFEQDIDDLIQSFKDLDYRPALKVGHTKPDKPGAPAYGYITNLRKKVVGDVVKLVADFEGMHDSVFNAIRNRLYDRVSSEIYFNIERGKKVYRRALKAVALLGAEVPAVANLVPLHKIEFASQRAAAVFTAHADLDVPRGASMEALEDRISGIKTFIRKESRKMKLRSRTKRIKQLKTQLGEYNEQMETLKGEKNFDEDSPKFKKLVKLANEMQEEIDELEEQNEDFNAKDRIKRLEAELARSESARRKDQVEKRVARCKIPALRSTLEGLFAYALEHSDETIEVFSEKDGKKTKEKKSLIEVVEGFVDESNRHAEKLFKALGTTHHDDKGDSDEAASLEVDRRATKLVDEDKEGKLTYTEAMTKVFKADPDLKKRYDDEMVGDNSSKRRLN
jgi:hypothetical protein